MFKSCIRVLAALVIFLAKGEGLVNTENIHTNRLINEKSPYLLQHAHNPVDWYPWGREAFKKAEEEDKPIFLSIGYSTCHWCHVMEEESFSNPEIAKIMNEHFVAIKVDREERPDIDNLYMGIVVSLTGSGGWPLTVFLTPDKKPFYGGTYFPSDDRWGRPGLKTVLKTMLKAWKNRKEEILHSSESLIQAIREQVTFKSQKAITLNKDTLKQAYLQLLQNFDASNGGFGSAPKFPMGHTLSFLLRYWRRGEQRALEMLEKTLSSMREGGLYDHLGGGFHRYATDSQWRIPHFEKMLYDQALLSKAYLEAYQATHKLEYADTARQIFEYVLREMTHPEGGFFSAEDADSASPENPQRKQEGAFYLWSKEEVIKILREERGEIFSYSFGIEPKGNVSNDPYGEFRGKNILYLAHNLKETAKHFKKSPKEIERVIKGAKEELFSSRAKRPRPHLDDKILTDWNGLMISSLAFGSRVLEEPGYAQAAEKSAQFILKHLVTKEARLLHRYREGEAAISGMLEDYAFFIQGLIDLYEATFKVEYLREARRLTIDIFKIFWDNTEGGFFFTANDAEELLLRSKEISDGAIPSGNSVAALNLIRLGRLTMEEEFAEKVETLLKVFSEEISRMPNAYLQMLIALDFALGPSREIVIAGRLDSKDTAEMIRIIYKRFIPNKVVALNPLLGKDEGVVSLIPLLKEKLPLNGRATVYLCENYVCKLPTTNLKELQELLER